MDDAPVQGLERSSSELRADAPRVTIDGRELADSLPWIGALWTVVVVIAVVLQEGLGVKDAVSSAVVDGGLIFIFGLMVEQIASKRSERRRWEQNLPLFESAAEQAWGLATDATHRVLRAAGVASAASAADALGPPDVASDARKAIAESGRLAKDSIDRAALALRSLSESPARQMLLLDDGALGVNHAASELVREGQEALRWASEVQEGDDEPDLQQVLDHHLGRVVNEWERFWHAARRR